MKKKLSKKQRRALAKQKVSLDQQTSVAPLLPQDIPHIQLIQPAQKKVFSQALLYVLPCVLLIALISIKLSAKATAQSLQTNVLPIVPQEISQDMHALPVATNASLSETVSSQAMVVIDKDTKSVLLQRNEAVRFPMASTTKIMTALTALAYYHPDDVLTIYTDTVEGAAVGFKKNERVTFVDMLYGMMLPSGNDAATAIAENYPGGKEAFVVQMNNNAQALHLYDTHYADATGLNDGGNYTTALDLARLAAYAMDNPFLAEVVATKQKTITNVDKTATYTLTNLNRLLGKDGIVGVKTGFTEQAGEVLVTAKKQDGHTLIIVIMKSKDRFSDTEDVLATVEKNISFISLEDVYVSKKQSEDIIQSSLGN